MKHEITWVWMFIPFTAFFIAMSIILMCSIAMMDRLSHGNPIPNVQTTNQLLNIVGILMIGFGLLTLYGTIYEVVKEAVTGIVERIKIEAAFILLSLVGYLLSMVFSDVAWWMKIMNVSFRGILLVTVVIVIVEILSMPGPIIPRRYQ